MDLELTLLYQEQNDNEAIILTDDTDNWDSSDTNIDAGTTCETGLFYEIVSQAVIDFTDYGAPDNTVGTRFVMSGTPTLGTGDELTPVTSTIAEITAMTLDVTITGTDEVATAKTQVDLLTEFGPFTSQDDLVFTITSELLGDTADDVLEDGLYTLEYNVSYMGDGTENTKTDVLGVSILVYGVVKAATYEKLRSVPVWYMCSKGCPSPEINEADLCGAYLSGIENGAYTAKTEELLGQLVTLTNIITNGSNITW